MSVIFFRLYILPSSWWWSTGGQGRRTWENVMKREVTMQGDGWRTSSATGCFLRLVMRIMQTSVPSLLVNMIGRCMWTICYKICYSMSACLSAHRPVLNPKWHFHLHSLLRWSTKLWNIIVLLSSSGQRAVQDIMTLPRYHISLTLPGPKPLQDIMFIRPAVPNPPLHQFTLSSIVGWCRSPDDDIAYISQPRPTAELPNRS